MEYLIGLLKKYFYSNNIPILLYYYIPILLYYYIIILLYINYSNF